MVAGVHRVWMVSARELGVVPTPPDEPANCRSPEHALVVMGRVTVATPPETWVTFEWVGEHFDSVTVTVTVSAAVPVRVSGGEKRTEPPTWEQWRPPLATTAAVDDLAEQPAPATAAAS